MNISSPASAGRIRHALAFFLAGVFSAITSHAAITPFADDFDGSLNTAVWTLGKGGANALNPNTSGGALRLNTTGNPPQNSSNDHAEVTSVRADFNPFDNGALQITLNGISLSAQANTAFGSGSLFVGVGNTTASSLPGAGKLSMSINLEKGANNADPAFYTLRIHDGAATANIGNLSGVPTDVVWVIDGSTKTWSVVLSGATFTSGLFSGTNAANGTFSSFTATDITNGSQLFLGVKNASWGWAQGAVGGISVTAIPEPSSVALIAGGGVILMTGVLRRKRQSVSN